MSTTHGDEDTRDIKTRRAKSYVDMTSKKQPGEVVYTQVQSTRMINFIVRTLVALRRTIVVSTVIVLSALLVYAVVSNNQIHKTQQLVAQRCEDRKNGRDALRTLISVAINDNDGDGQPDQPTNVDLNLLTKTSQYMDLDANDKAMWTLVLGGLGNDNKGGNTQTTTDRLIAFRKSLPTIKCDG